MSCFGALAQRIEYQTSNLSVLGSNPRCLAKKKKSHILRFLLCFYSDCFSCFSSCSCSTIVCVLSTGNMVLCILSFASSTFVSSRKTQDNAWLPILKQGAEPVEPTRFVLDTVHLRILISCILASFLRSLFLRSVLISSLTTLSVDAVFSENRIQPTNTLYSSNMRAIMGLVAEGYGVSFLFDAHLRRAEERRFIRLFRFGSRRVLCDFVAASRAGSYLPHCAQDFVEIVREAALPTAGDSASLP